MNYGSEIELPTQQINNSVKSIVPSQNYEATLQSIQPYQQQRDQTISGLSKDYDFHTQQIVHTMDETEVANQTRRDLKNAQGQNTGIKNKIQEEKKQLDKAKQELQLQISKQKIVFDLFFVFGITIFVYLIFRSFEYVHLIALVVLVIGMIYVLQYNAYSIRLFGDDHSAKISISSGGKSIQETGNKWWDSLKPTTTPSFDISKWTFMTTAQ